MTYQVRQTGGSWQTAELGYDAQSRLAEINGLAAGKVSIRYGEKVMTLATPEAEIKYVFAPSGRLKRAVTSWGEEVLYVRDEGLLDAVTVRRGDLEFTDRFSEGRLMQVGGSTSKPVEYAYLPVGQFESVLLLPDGEVGGRSRGYDTEGRLVESDLPDDRRITLTYGRGEQQEHLVRVEISLSGRSQLAERLSDSGTSVLLAEKRGGRFLTDEVRVTL